jgi:hypothetical protein
MDELIKAFHPVIALFRPYILRLTGFSSPFFVLWQNRKFKAHILAYLPGLDIAVRPNGKSGRVSGNSVDHFQVAI